MIKQVTGYEGKYFVDDNGYVFNAVGLELIQQLNTGYCTVTLYKNSVAKNVLVHRLVAYEFCEKRFEQAQVHHIDKNPYNNKAANLIWCTDSEHGKLNHNHTYTAIKATNVISGKVCLFPTFSCLQYYEIDAEKVRKRIKNGKTYQQCRWELCYEPIDPT